MGRTRFKAGRPPEYQVVTVCQPEAIDSISLKFRDLHTIHAIMADYTRAYVDKVEAEHKRCGTHIDLTAPVSPDTRALENQLRIMFSAQISTYTTIMSYLGKTLDTTGKQWLQRRIDTHAGLNALERLRNMDVHNEPLHTFIGISYIITDVAAPFSSTDTREVHQHLGLAHRGIGFFPAALADAKQFSSQPGLVEYLTFDSILNLAHASIHEVAAALAAAASEGHSKDTSPRSCGLCGTTWTASPSTAVQGHPSQAIVPKELSLTATRSGGSPHTASDPPAR